MRPFALILLAFTPAAAWAQTAVLDITLVQGRGDAGAVFGPDDCSDEIPITWTVTPLRSCSPLRIWMTTENCLSDPAGGDLTIQTQPENTDLSTDTFRRRVDQLPLFVADAGADGGVACSSATADITWKLCGNVKFSVNFGTCDSTASESTPPTIRFDSIAPRAPVITSAEGLDSSISVKLDIDTNDTAVVIVEATDPSGERAARVERSTPIGSIRLGNLTNFTTYKVTAQARDEAGNISETSEPMQATPVPTLGFFERYVDAGGSEDGGCSSGGGAALGAIGAAAGVLLAWRRRRRWR